MMLWQALVNNLSLKLLALLLAVALWLLATGATDTKRELSVPLTMRNLSPELVVASPIPEFVDVTIAGPRSGFSGCDPKKCRLSWIWATSAPGPLPSAAWKNGLEFLRVSAYCGYTRPSLTWSWFANPDGGRNRD